MKKTLYRIILFILLPLVLITGYNKYQQLPSSYTKRINKTVNYWSKIVPDADINRILKKYGTPLSHEIKKINRNQEKPDQYDKIHQLIYKDLDIIATNGADGYNAVTSVSIKTKKIKLKYGLHVGIKAKNVIKKLGQPFDKQIMGNKSVFTYIPIVKADQYGQMLGYVEFIFTDDIVSSISWLTIIDD